MPWQLSYEVHHNIVTLDSVSLAKTQLNYEANLNV